MAKRYYWMKLKPTFFDKRVKALRRVCGADGVLVYQKMILQAIDGEEDDCGIIHFCRYFPTIAEEIADDIDEDTQLVEQTINELVKYGMAEYSRDGDLYIYTAAECAGREGESAERMRKLRQRRREEDYTASHCDKETSHSDGEALQSAPIKNKDKEKEPEIEEEVTSVTRLRGALRHYIGDGLKPQERLLAEAKILGGLSGLSEEA